MKVLFFGTPDFSVPTLKALIELNNCQVSCVITQPDRPQGRGKQIQSSPIKQLATLHSIPVIQPESIKKLGSNFITTISEFGPYDVAVVVAFGQLLPVAVLDLPRLGSINIHASLLPKWRGAAPIQRALIAGDTETGISLMKMEAGLDSGPVYCVEKVKIEEFDNFEILHDRLSHLGAKLLIEKLPLIVNGKVTATKQPTEGITYAHKITNDDCLINWNQSAASICNLIRGLDPVPGAFTLFNGKRIKIYQAIPVNAMHSGSFNAGQIVKVDPVRLEVQTLDGIVSILKLQIEGKRPMSISEFIKGQTIQVGDVLTGVS